MNKLFPVAISMSAFSIMVLLFADCLTTNPTDDDYTAGYEDDGTPLPARQGNPGRDSGH